jgi:hypothetical protein
MPAGAATETASFSPPTHYPSTWTSQANTLAVGEAYYSCVTANNNIYCVGGSGTSSPYTFVQYASIPSSGGSTSTWASQGNSLAGNGQAYESCITANNYVYCMGGAMYPSNNVLYASVPSGVGPTSTWTSQTNTLAVGEQSESCVTANNYIYCMGGWPTNSVVQYAKIPSGGGPTTTWTSQTNTLAVGEEDYSCVTANNYIYCMGGYYGTNMAIVQYASIPSGGGPTSTWTSQIVNTLAVGEDYESCVTVSNYIYCMGGSASTSVVQYASIPSGGGPTTTWTSSAYTLAVGEQAQSCFIANNYIYCLGGANSNAVVQYTSLSASPVCYPLTLAYGTGGASATAFPANSVGCSPGTYFAGDTPTLTATASGGYTFSSWTGTSSSGSNPWTFTMPASSATETASFTFFFSPASGPWTSQTSNTLAVFGEWGLGCVTANNYLYCMGGETTPNAVQYAKIPSGGGPTGAWTSSANVLPVPVYWESCVNAGNYIYCLGGSGGTTAVQYASISSSGGDASTWTSQTSNLLAVSGSYLDSCVTANNYIYCMGGETSGNTVQYAKIPSGGGPTGAWTSQTSNKLVVGENEESCVTANNYIYCMGGSSTSPYLQVQYASIPSGGGPTGAWTSQSTNTLAVEGDGTSCVTTGNYIYCLGGAVNSGVYTPVQYASIPSGGGPTGAWTSSANTLAVGEYDHSCVTANNYLYCLGGYQGTNQAVVQYAIS